MGKSETTISGAAITSTLKHMSMIGDIGKEILKKFGIKKIDIKKEYTFKVRGDIHSETRKRFGEEALYYYGLTMMEGYKKLREKDGGLKTNIFYGKNKKMIHSKNLSEARTARNKYFEVFQMETDAMTKASIFTPEKGIVGANMKIISKDIIEFTLTNAVLLENEIFNRGLVSDYLYHLKKDWIR